MAVTKFGDCCAHGNDDLSNKLISNGNEASIIEGSDSGSMNDLFDDHLDNISQFSHDTVKCVNEVNKDTVKCIYINSESLLYGSGNRPTNDKLYDSPGILIHSSSLIANSLCGRHSTLGGAVTGLSDCSVHSVCDGFLGQSLPNDREALTQIQLQCMSYHMITKIAFSNFTRHNSHDSSMGGAASGFSSCCAHGDSDLSNQSISSSSETLIYGTDSELACSLSDISQENISSSSQDTVIHPEIKILSLNTGGLRSKVNNTEFEETISNYDIVYIQEIPGHLGP